MSAKRWALLSVLLAARGVVAADGADVLATDAAFAARSLEAGQQVAFLEYLAEDGVLFRPGPVRGRDWLGSHEPATGRLEWVPAAAAVDCSATLAASTGRWAYSNAAGGEPVAGHYLTIWRREPDGDWRAVLDHGIDHAAGASPSVLLAPAFDLLWPRNVQDCAPEGSAALLADAEAKLNRSTVRRGSAEALRRRVAEGAIAYRDDGPPALLTPEWPPGEASLGMGGIAQTDGTIVTDRSDLAVTYGSIRDADAGSESGSRVFYVRVWRYVDEGWRVAIDLQTPMPAEAAH